MRVFIDRTHNSKTGKLETGRAALKSRNDGVAGAGASARRGSGLRERRHGGEEHRAA